MHFSSSIIMHKVCIDLLKEIGAVVLDMEGIMFVVKFDIDGLNINYLYHRNPDNTFLLERIKPFQMIIGQYDSEQVVVETIKSDLDQIRNAKKSSNFDKFVSINKDLYKIMRNFDDLFLYYNVNSKDLEYINDNAKELWQAMYRIKEHSKRVYHKTNPQSLKD